MRQWVTPDWPAPDNIRAICTTVNYGNLATHAGESESVMAHRAKLRADCNLKYEPAWLNQTHSNCVKEVQEPIQEVGQVIENCDASYTRLNEQPCVVLTADCLPLLICDKAGEQIAAVHAGWRGLANGVIAQTLSHFAHPEDVLVWLGPAISLNAFEVGQEVADIFLSLDPAYKQAIHSRSIDIYHIAKIQLGKLGVEQYYGGEYCTYSQPHLFYSFRRDKLSGRMASMIWKKP